MTTASIGLALRSLLWTFLFPGVFAGYLPWRFFGLDRVRVDWADPIHLAGVMLGTVGTRTVGTRTVGTRTLGTRTPGTLGTHPLAP